MYSKEDIEELKKEAQLETKKHKAAGQQGAEWQGDELHDLAKVLFVSFVIAPAIVTVLALGLVHVAQEFICSAGVCTDTFRIVLIAALACWLFFVSVYHAWQENRGLALFLVIVGGVIVVVGFFLRSK